MCRKDNRIRLRIRRRPPRGSSDRIGGLSFRITWIWRRTRGIVFPEVNEEREGYVRNRLPGDDHHPCRGPDLLRAEAPPGPRQKPREGDRRIQESVRRGTEGDRRSRPGSRIRREGLRPRPPPPRRPAPGRPPPPPPPARAAP